MFVSRGKRKNRGRWKGSRSSWSWPVNTTIKTCCYVEVWRRGYASFSSDKPTCRYSTVNHQIVQFSCHLQQHTVFSARFRPAPSPASRHFKNPGGDLDSGLSFEEWTKNPIWTGNCAALQAFHYHTCSYNWITISKMEEFWPSTVQPSPGAHTIDLNIKRAARLVIDLLQH